MSQSNSKIPVSVLGATGSVGQRFLTLLRDHPWFEVAAVCASERSAGRPYGEVVEWCQVKPLDERIASMVVRRVDDELDTPIVFSALDASVAGDVETLHAERGRAVVTNAKSHRMDDDVPLLVPEVNADHLGLIAHQPFAQSGGSLIANPNCSTIGVILALAPLHRAFGVKRASIVTMQALSGAGMSGVPGMETADNLIPHIGGEEDKLENETRKLFGSLNGRRIDFADVVVSAQCNRVSVVDGHTACVSIEFESKPTREAILEAWSSFRAEPQSLDLPTAPATPTRYLDEDASPQPKLHRDVDKGMATTIGRLRTCPILDWKFVCLSHNTLRGAAGGALLCAELAVARGVLTGLSAPGE